MSETGAQGLNKRDAAEAHQGWPYGISSFERRLGNGATRALVAIVAIPILLIVLWNGGWWISGLALLLSIACVVEMGSMLRASQIRIHWSWVIGVTILTHLLVAIGLNSDMNIGLTSGLMFTSLILSVVILMISSLSDQNEFALRGLAGSSLSFLYAGLLLVSLPILYGVVPHYLARSIEPGADGVFPTLPIHGGFELTMMMFIAIWLTDTGAYLVGRKFGRRKLAITISPNKSIEGAVGGLLFAMIATLFLGDILLPELDLTDLVMIGLIAGVVGQLGDLAESHLKRATGVKDSSAIIPGHGGVLDRFDSLLLVAPSLLCYLSIRVTIERLLS